MSMRHIRLPSQYKWDTQSSEILRCVKSQKSAGLIYRVSIKSFPYYRHLLRENYVEYKHIFLPLLKLVSKILCHVFIVMLQKICLYSTWFSLNPLKPELNPIFYLLALLGAHHFLHVSRIRVKSLTFRWLISYIYGAPILDVSRSHTTTQHSR